MLFRFGGDGKQHSAILIETRWEIQSRHDEIMFVMSGEWGTEQTKEHRIRNIVFVLVSII